MTEKEIKELERKSVEHRDLSSHHARSIDDRVNEDNETEEEVKKYCSSL